MIVGETVMVVLAVAAIFAIADELGRRRKK